jgi:hypothetical protein
VTPPTRSRRDSCAYVDLDDVAFADQQRAQISLFTGPRPPRSRGCSRPYAQGKTDAAILLATIGAGRAALPAQISRP